MLQSCAFLFYILTQPLLIIALYVEMTYTYFNLYALATRGGREV